MKKEQKSEFLSSRVRYVPINDIRPNPQQPRRRFDPEGLQELAASIAAYGILQPLTVRQQGGVYQLVAGERRWRAARIAGLRQVPCLLAWVDEEDAALLALIENLQRRDLDYMEEAEALSDRIGIMKEGRLVFCGTAVEMKAKSGKDSIESAFIEIVKNASKGTSKEAKE